MVLGLAFTSKYRTPCTIPGLKFSETVCIKSRSIHENPHFRIIRSLAYWRHRSLHAHPNSKCIDRCFVLQNHLTIQSRFSSVPPFLPLPACHSMPPTLPPGTRYRAFLSLLPLPTLCCLGFLLHSSRKTGGALVVLCGLRGGRIVIHLCHRLRAHCVI